MDKTVGMITPTNVDSFTGGFSTVSRDTRGDFSTETPTERSEPWELEDSR